MTTPNSAALSDLLATRAPDNSIDLADAFAFIAVDQWSQNLAARVIHGLTKTFPVLTISAGFTLEADYEDQIEVRRQDQDGNGPAIPVIFFPDAPARLELPRLIQALCIALDEIQARS